MSGGYIIDLDEMIQKCHKLSEAHIIKSDSLQYAQISAWLLELKHRRSSSAVKNTKSNLRNKTEETFSLLQELCSTLELNSLNLGLPGTKAFVIRMIDRSSLSEE